MEGHCLLERSVRPRSVHSGGQVEQQDVEIGTSGCAFPMVSWFMFVMISDKSMRTGEDVVAVKRERVERLLASEAKAEEEGRGEEAKGEKTLS